MHVNSISSLNIKKQINYTARPEKQPGKPAKPYDPYSTEPLTEKDVNTLLGTAAAAFAIAALLSGGLCSRRDDNYSKYPAHTPPGITDSGPSETEHRISPEKLADRIFKVFDLNGNGIITAGELSAVGKPLVGNLTVINRNDVRERLGLPKNDYGTLTVSDVRGKLELTDKTGQRTSFVPERGPHPGEKTYILPYDGTTTILDLNSLRKRSLSEGDDQENSLPLTRAQVLEYLKSLKEHPDLYDDTSALLFPE